jgi:hypothetical protein
MKSFIKISLFLIILICNISILNAQSTVWRQIIGDQYNEVGYDVIELRDKGFLMVGTKEIMVPGSSFLTIQSYLVRLDKNGNIVWQKTIGDSVFVSYAVSVIEDPFGNIYLPCEISNIAYLIKMNSFGEILWNKEYGSYGIERFVGISFVDSYSKFMLVSHNDINNTTTSSLTKLDTSGNFIWNKLYYDSIPNFSYYSSVGNCFLFLENSYFLTGGKGINGFIIKTDTSGNIIWNKRYSKAEYIYSIAINSDNKFIGTGIARSYGTFCFKFDGNGDTIWTKDFGLDSANYFGYSKIVRTYDGNFGIGTGGPKIGIMDSLGNINTVFRNSYPENIDVAQLNLNVISDSGFVVTGFYGYPPSNNNSKTLLHDAIIFNVDKNGTMIAIKNHNEIVADSFEIITFPNPYNLSFKLSFNLSRTSQIKVELYNLSGKKVKEIENKNLNIGNHQYLINTPELSSGIYFIRFEIKDKVYTKKVLLIK